MARSKRIAVTGGSGQLGAAVIRELLESGYEALSLDRNPAQAAAVPAVAVDLNRYDELAGALRGCDAVIHLAADPSPYSRPAHLVFSNNVSSAYNVLETAAALGIPKAVLASSESAYGFPWAVRPLSPLYLPIDERHPLQPQEGYGLSKCVAESIGEMFHRRTGMQVVALRLSTLIGEDNFASLLAQMTGEPSAGKLLLWSYIGLRDAATACRLACEADGLGAVSLNITADDTCAGMRSLDLIRTYYPEVTDLRAAFLRYEALYSNAAAKRLLGWSPTCRIRRLPD